MKFPNDDDKRPDASTALCPSITEAKRHGAFSAAMLEIPEIVLAALHGFLQVANELRQSKDGDNLGNLEAGNSVSTLLNALAVGMMKLGQTHANLNTVLKHPEFAHFRLGLTCLYMSLRDLGYTTESAAADYQLIKQHTEEHAEELLRACKVMGHRIEGLEGHLPNMGK